MAVETYNGQEYSLENFLIDLSPFCHPSHHNNLEDYCSLLLDNKQSKTLTTKQRWTKHTRTTFFYGEELSSSTHYEHTDLCDVILKFLEADAIEKDNYEIENKLILEFEKEEEERDAAEEKEKLAAAEEKSKPKQTRAKETQKEREQRLR